MLTLLWVAAGGAIGSAMRYGVNVWSGRVLGADFPWATLIVNVVGCLLIGLIAGLMAFKLTIGSEMRAFLMTGILGGFTTFSAFSLDFALLAERKAYALAAAYGTGSILLSLLAVFAGLALARSLAA
jgi:fluoride exporter